MTTQSFSTERDLTPEEIRERDKLRDDLDEERDGLITAVEDRRKEIRGFNVKRKKIEVQLRDVRRELRTGKVFESPQTVMPFEDPPATARHGEGELLDPVELRHLISCVRPPELWPTLKDVKSWHEDVRADVQRWCRVEHARATPIAGLPLPDSFAIPNVLENVAYKDIPGVQGKASIERHGVWAGRKGKRKATARKAGKRARA
jgi:hypothetical protein